MMSKALVKRVFHKATKSVILEMGKDEVIWQSIAHIGRACKITYRSAWFAIYYLRRDGIIELDDLVLTRKGYIVAHYLDLLILAMNSRRNIFKESLHPQLDPDQDNFQKRF